MIERRGETDDPAERWRPTWLLIAIAWLIGRALDITMLTTVGVRESPRIDTNRLLIWDGHWYRQIMEHGYGARPAVWPPDVGGWTTFPFFPLFPFSARLLHTLGAPMLVSLTLLPNLAALAAAFGVYRLARTVHDHRTALVAACLLGLLPGALTFSMAYPDSLFLAASVWAVVLATERRPLLAGLVAAVATAVRPNGVLLLVPLVLVVVAAWPKADTPRETWRPRLAAIAVIAAPSAAFLGAWCWFMDRRTGDPLAFFTAKSAWDETTLWEWITGGGRQATLHFVIGGAFLATVFVTARRHPPAWTVHAVLCIAPSLLLGMVGMIRYSAQAFAVPIAVATLTAARRALLVGTIVALVLVSAVYTDLISRHGWVP